jgi:ubiquinone/menaquinone biosynthesis C-methylase UbiE
LSLIQSWFITIRIWLILAVTIIAALASASGCGNQGDAERIAALLNLRPGTAVADVGAGKGDMAVDMARKVGPTGRVYATEIDSARLQQIRTRVRKDALGNVIVIEGGEKDTMLPPGCCEAIYMRGVYHHLTDPENIDASLYRALKPGGEMAIQDFRPTIWLAPWTPKGIPANRGGHGVPPEIVADEMTAAGFQVEKTIDPWSDSWFFSNYCLVFRKPPR